MTASFNTRLIAQGDGSLYGDLVCDLRQIVGKLLGDAGKDQQDCATCVSIIFGFGFTGLRFVVGASN